MLFWGFLADSFQVLEKSFLASSSSILDRLSAFVHEAHNLRNKKLKKDKVPELEVKISMRRSQEDNMPKMVGRLSGDHDGLSGSSIPHYYFQISK